MKSSVAILAAVVVALCAGAGSPHGLARTAGSDRVSASSQPAWATDQLHVQPAWVLNSADPPRDGPIVGVLDTGVTPVSDLDGALVPGFDAYGGGETHDENGHGTAVATLIAGRHDGIGADGVCPTCRIMPLKIAGADGRAPDDAQAAAIDWAVAHGVMLLNISFVGTEPGGPVADAISNAVAHGVTVIASAGNEATYAERWPAAYPEVVGVAATDESGGLAGYSNRGADWIDLAAPGCAPAMNPEQQTVTFCGTSAAAPLTAGSAALLKSLAPQDSYGQIVGALLRTADPLDGGVVRYGRLDVEAAMHELGVSTSAQTTALPSALTAYQARLLLD